MILITSLTMAGRFLQRMMEALSMLQEMHKRFSVQTVCGWENIRATER